MQQFKAVKRQRITWTKSQKAKNKIPSHGPNKKKDGSMELQELRVPRTPPDKLHTHIYIIKQPATPAA